MDILVATNNKHKLIEIKQIFELEFSNKFNWLTSKDLTSEKFEVDETGSTFAENSKIKAIEYFNKFKIPTIADDSGLIVDQLGGQPGVHSARYSGENATDVSNRNLIKFRLATIGVQESSARFVCVMTYYDGQNIIQSEGVCEGKIIDHEKGANGFGYDPLFIPDGYDKTFAELDSDIKNKISHRSAAIRNLVEILKKEKFNS